MVTSSLYHAELVLLEIWCMLNLASNVTCRSRASESVGTLLDCLLFDWQASTTSSSFSTRQVLLHLVRINPTCNRFEKVKQFYQCGRCKPVSYCCQKCQVDDWKAQKVACGRANREIVNQSYFSIRIIQFDQCFMGRYRRVFQSTPTLTKGYRLKGSVKPICIQ